MNTHDNDTVNSSNYFTVYDLRNYLEEHYGANNLSSTTGRDLRLNLQTKANIFQSIEKEFKNSAKTTNSLIPTDLMDDIGSKVFLTLRELMDSPPQILKHLIENNINVSELQQLFINSRNDKSSDVNYYRNLTVIQLDTPLKSTYDTRSAVDIDNYIIEETRKFYTNNYPTALNQDEPIPEKDIKDYEKALQRHVSKLEEAYSPVSRIKFDRLFISHYDTYSKQLQDKNDANIKLITIERELNQINNLESVVGAYEAMIATIILNIKSIVNLNEHLATLLHKKAVITATNEEVVDPLYTSNLSGIYAILKEKYSNDSFVNLSTHLLHIFSWQLGDEHAMSPELALKDMNDFISIWTRKKLWEKLTFDMFISFALLKGLPMKCPIRQNLIKDINKFITSTDSKSSESHNSSESVSSETASSSSMPIYDEITKIITRNVDDRKLINLGKGQSPAKVPNYPNSASGNSNYNRRPRYQNESLVRTDTAASTNDTSKRTVIEFFDKKLYSSEIFKANQIYIKIQTKNGPYDIPYYAVNNNTSICPNCFPSDPSKGTSVPCKPQCYGKLCTRCKYYGHQSRSCLQINDTNGHLIK